MVRMASEMPTARFHLLSFQLPLGLCGFDLNKFFKHPTRLESIILHVYGCNIVIQIHISSMSYATPSQEIYFSSLSLLLLFSLVQ